MNPNLKSSKLLISLIVLLAFGLRLYQLDGQSLWWDEIKTISRATIPLQEMLNDIITKRGHLPLYFLVMRAWTELGTTAFIVRFYSVLWGTISIPLLYKVSRLIGGRRVGLFAAFLLAVSPFHIWYSQEARMYSQGPALIIGGHIFLILALRSGKKSHWLGYTITMLLAVYTHYFSLLIMAAHYVFLAFHYRFLRERFKQWLVTAVVIGGVFGLWVLNILRDGGYGEGTPGWITLAAWYEPWQTFLAFSAGRTIDPESLTTYIVLFLYLVGVVTAFAVALRRKPTQQNSLGFVWTDSFSVRLLFCWLLVPLAITYVVSLDWQLFSRPSFSIYIDRYLIVILPALPILVSVGYASLARQQKWLFYVASAVIFLFTMPSLLALYNDPTHARINFRDAFATLAVALSDNDVLLGRPDHEIPLAYYADTPPLLILPPDYIDSQVAEAFAAEMSSTLAEVKADRLWLISTVYVINPHGFAQARNRTLKQGDVRQVWLDAHYERINQWDFPGIRLSLYEVP